MPPSGPAEIEPIREFYAEFGDKLPDELTRQLDRLEERVGRRGPLNRPRDARVSAPRSPADQAANTADRGRGPGPA